MDPLLKENLLLKINGPVSIVRNRRAPATENNLAFTAVLWKQFCVAVDLEDEKEALECKEDSLYTTSKAQIYEAFLTWALSCRNIRAEGTLVTYWTNVRMLHRDRAGYEIGPNVSKQVLSDLSRRYNLLPKVREKSEMSAVDLWFVLRHLWAYDVEQYHSERQRLQMAFMLQIAAFTASRPGAVIESSCARDSNRALKYRHCELKLIENPENTGKRHIWVLEITLVYLKGDNESKFPQTFTIHEDEEQPAFCPIMSFLALAFADKAFKANELQNPGDLQRIQISSPLRCQKINWKDSILDTPVLRQVDKSGVIQACAWKYSSFQKKLVQLGKATGFEKNVTIYCARRETGNLLNKFGVHERKQVMRHRSSSTFDRNYLSQHVARDVQNIYRGIAENSAVRTSAQMSLTMDPRAPYKLTEKHHTLIRNEPQIQFLRKTKTEKLKLLKSRYGSIKNGVGTNIHKEYKEAHYNLERRKKAIGRKMTDSLRNDYFSTIHQTTLQQQLSSDGPGSPVKEQEILSRVHTFPERSRVADVFFFSSEDVKSESHCHLTEQQIQLINDLANLCKFREIRQKCCFEDSKVAQDEGSTDEIECKAIKPADEVDPDLYPYVLGNVCLYCLGDENLFRAGRERVFLRISSLRRHVRSNHPCADKSKSMTCPHPACTNTSENHMAFLRHAADVHKIFY